jgi:ribonuclease HII
MHDFSSMTLNEIRQWLDAKGKVKKEWVKRLLQDSRAGVHKLGGTLKKRLEEEEKEAARIDSMWSYERRYRADGIRYIAGIDEAGRGPLAGPVVAAAVILPTTFKAEGLNDSKQLTQGEREELRERIMSGALSIGVGIVDVDYIDHHNILQATYEAMRQAVRQCKPDPELLLLDAVKVPGLSIPQVPIIKGDALSHSIAAASIIAKTTRDRIMVDYAKEYPQYGFEEHKGYSAPFHYRALDQYGPCPIHRRSFKPIADRLTEDLFSFSEPPDKRLEG